MAEFIDFEVVASGDDLDDAEDFEMEVDNPTFIDDAEQENDDHSFYRFHDQTRDPEQVLAERAWESAILAQNWEACNYIEHEDHEGDIDEFKNAKKSRQIFLDTLVSPLSQQTKENSFFLNLIYAINYFKNKEAEEIEEEELKNKVGEQFYNDLKAKESMCVLNLIRRDFDKMCYDINEILIKNNLFWRVYELKDKFRYLFHQNEEGTEVKKSVSACIKEKFNGFNIAAPTLSKKRKERFISHRHNLQTSQIKRGDCCMLFFYRH